MNTFEQRLEALELDMSRVMEALPSAAKPAPKPERWIPKEGTRTLCWIDDWSQTTKTSADIIIGCDGSQYTTLLGVGWKFATPLTTEEVVAMTYRPGTVGIKSCENCANYNTRVRRCVNCVIAVNNGIQPSHWQPADSLEERPEV
jgi:hypothetical protein